MYRIVQDKRKSDSLATMFTDKNRVSMPCSSEVFQTDNENALKLL